MSLRELLAEAAELHNQLEGKTDEPETSQMEELYKKEAQMWEKRFKELREAVINPDLGNESMLAPTRLPKTMISVSEDWLKKVIDLANLGDN